MIMNTLLYVPNPRRGRGLILERVSVALVTFKNHETSFLGSSGLIRERTS